MAEQFDFDLKNYLPVLATAYGEGANLDYTEKLEILSTIFNRAESGSPDFRAENGKMSEVLEQGYYSYSQKSPKFKEAISQKFPDKMSEDSFKEFAQILGGILKGKIKKTESQFFLKPKEVKRFKEGAKELDINLLEKTYEGKGHIYFKYKENPKPKKKGKKKTEQIVP